MKKTRSWSRRCAVQSLYQWQLSGGDTPTTDLEYLAEEDSRKVNLKYFKQLIEQLTTKTAKQLIEQLTTKTAEIDGLISPALDRQLADVDPVESAILRVGVCELAYHPEIPCRVVINESVELAKVFGAEHGHKYVNSILDKLARQLRATEMKTG